MNYAVSSTPTVFVDHEALANLVRECSLPGTKAVLVGFGEYAKHLINLCPESVVAIYDPGQMFQGKNLKFRGVPVLDAPTMVEANCVLGCEYKYLYEYFSKIVKAFNRARYYYPPRLAYKDTSQIDAFAQEGLYQEIFLHQADAPISMMSGDKLRFLIELLRTGLLLSPDASVLEMGSWQGGSSWYIAKTISALKRENIFYMIDLFETHSMDPTATMCTDEIRVRMASVYENVELVVGLVNDRECLNRVKPPLCFAHIDLGPEEVGLEFAWDNLLPGAPLLLDNYGHLAAPTWKFDDFFWRRQARVTRLPWSEQGFVFKTNPHLSQVEVLARPGLASSTVLPRRK